MRFFTKGLFINVVKSTGFFYKAPSNLNYNWNYGFFALVLLAKAPLRPDRIINPLSQNTGTLTVAPIKDMAKAGRFFPTNLKIKSAIRMAAPDFSKIIPMILPMITISPI